MIDPLGQHSGVRADAAPASIRRLALKLELASLVVDGEELDVVMAVAYDEQRRADMWRALCLIAWLIAAAACVALVLR